MKKDVIMKKNFKNLILFISFILVSLLIGTNLSICQSDTCRLGQVDPCTYWWPNLEWEGPEYWVMNIGDCTYLIEFYYRDNEVNRAEAQITAIYELTGNQGCDVELETRQEAYVEIWQEFTEFFSPNYFTYGVEEHPCAELAQSGPSKVIYLIVEPVQLDTNMFNGLDHSINQDNDLVFSGISYLESCSDTICCYMHYQITREDEEIVTVEWNDPGYGDDQQECNNPMTCVPTCGYLKFNWYAEGYEPPGIPSLVNEYEFKGKSNIIPNPNEGNFILNYSSESTGSVYLTIYNSNGSRVYKEQFNKNNKSIKHQFSLSKLQNGNYFFNIRINGVFDSFGSFIINK